MNYQETFLQALFVFCQERDLDSSRLASILGRNTEMLNAEELSPVTNRQMETLWMNIVRDSDNALIGLHFGETMQLAALSVIGQIIQTSNTVKDALEQACALVPLLTDLYTMRINEGPQTFTVSFKKNENLDDFPVYSQQMGDFLVAFTLHELKGLVMEKVRPMKIELPTYNSRYDKIYENILRCRPQWSENYMLEFKTSYLKSKIISANHEIRNLLISQVDRQQDTASAAGSFSKRIFNFLIVNSYLYSLSIDSVADNFNLTVRTMQRKLKEEGVSYLQIISEVRKSLAIDYIRNTNSSIKEISVVLGYSEPSAFVRAFKKWTGKTPSAFRTQKDK
ncbi:MAG: AraC family transcriptional regulator ligand-binding domain-containing protein [Sphingobacterium sp.]